MPDYANRHLRIRPDVRTIPYETSGARTESSRYGYTSPTQSVQNPDGPHHMVDIHWHDVSNTARDFNGNPTDADDESQFGDIIESIMGQEFIESSDPNSPVCEIDAKIVAILRSSVHEILETIRVDGEPWIDYHMAETRQGAASYLRHILNLAFANGAF